ncbi:FAD-dependent monooxygenase [Nocardia brasiliensis]|uniref:FAD-dependent monooxygenase n=1 Tax=Nocardia brasiliensis TaxID=37326 RepID=UPI001892E16C|nr:FAD-dependent monooxygenase [Nocardia brasiliensis]MBF6128809.1 FAD-dependent monooxygenase [Nocardia brasiliensis]
MNTNPQAHSSRVQVLIVGGSIVGASAALFLAARGVTPVLVEKHATVSKRLRAKLFYPRTMEAYRAVGAADSIYAVERALPPSDHAAVVDSLAGAERKRWLLPAADDFSAVSPCPSAFVKQADVEEVVRAHARTAGADLRFGHRLVDLHQHENHVVARMLDADGTQYTVEADYLLAADGNSSTIRTGSGIGRSGEEVVAHVLEVGFDADLRPVLNGRRLAMAWADLPERAFLSWTTAQDRGAVSVQYDPAVTDPATFDDRRCREIVSRALGLPEPAFAVTGIRSWQMGGWVADTYRVGRVFLLGDAAHVTPPTGGFGANTGIQDAWNLTAKLVSVLRGIADPRLLDDYEPERRPIGRLTVTQALLRLGDSAESLPEQEPLLSEAAVALGYRYQLPGANPALPQADEPARWRGEPGTRLPHLWISDGVSTLDLVRDGRYLLLTGDHGRAWAQAASEVDPTGALLDVAALPPEADPADLCGIGDDGALLVRPDQVIAWRATDSTPNATAVLIAATRYQLGRGIIGEPEMSAL